ncbi:MAG: hypothetical protein HY815_05725 [Candidatus Riflebacteria bacterium]|nr:hypothetical protein [Candidatus Riflebacteria bacterium]
MRSFLLSLCIALALWSAVAQAQHPTTRTVVPWGKKPGALAYVPQGSAGGRLQNGPSSLRVGPDGDIFVLDTLASKVERFAPDGTHRRSIGFPSTDRHDAERLCVDLALTRDGGMVLLDRQSRTVLVLDRDGRMRAEVQVPIGGRRLPLLWAVDADRAGRLSVFDASDNSVIRFLRSGAMVGSARSDLAASLVMERDGRFVGLKVPSRENARTLEIWRDDPFARKRDLVARVSSRSEVAIWKLVGIDAAGRLFLETAAGAGDAPVRRSVHALSPDGKWLAKVPAPDEPVGLSMVRSSAVAPDGTVVFARPTGKGLLLERLTVVAAGGR